MQDDLLELMEFLLQLQRNANVDGKHDMALRFANWYAAVSTAHQMLQLNSRTPARTREERT